MWIYNFQSFGTEDKMRIHQSKHDLELLSTTMDSKQHAFFTFPNGYWLIIGIYKIKKFIAKNKIFELGYIPLNKLKHMNMLYETYIHLYVYISICIHIIYYHTYILKFQVRGLI